MLNQLLVELALLQQACGPQECCLCALGAGAGPGLPYDAQRCGDRPPGPCPGAPLPLLSAIRTLHYLDVGLSTEGAYLTEPWVYTQLGRRCARHWLELVLHCTPRQMGA